MRPFETALHLPVCPEEMEGNNNYMATIQTDVDFNLDTKEKVNLSLFPLKAPQFKEPALLKIMDREELTHVHPVVKHLLSGQVIPNVPLAGRLKYFLPAWESLTQDQSILKIVKGYQIPFQNHPYQGKPNPQVVNQSQSKLIEAEVLGLLEKGAISKSSHCEGEFLSNLFLVPKKDGSQRPVINLKALNRFIPYEHFKMEGLHCLKFMLEKGDYMCKIDLKDAYFSVPLHELSRKFVKFVWSNNVYEFLCLCFGLGPAPRIFTKLLKVPISLLRRLNIRVVIYLDDMLMLGSSIKNILIARDTVIFLLQHLGFIINWKKSILKPTQENF